MPGPTLDPDDIEYTREVLTPYLDATDKRTVMECLFGDGPCSTLGFTPRGLSPWAGLAVARHDARAAVTARYRPPLPPPAGPGYSAHAQAPPGGVGMSRSLVKAAAVGCSVLLAAGFVSYRAGAFDSFVRPTPAPVSLIRRRGGRHTRHARAGRVGFETGPAGHSLSSSKSAMIVTPLAPGPVARRPPRRRPSLAGPSRLPR